MAGQCKWHRSLVDDEDIMHTLWSLTHSATHGVPRDADKHPPPRSEDGQIDYERMCRETAAAFRDDPDSVWTGDPVWTGERCAVTLDAETLSTYGLMPNTDSRAADIGRVDFEDATDPLGNIRACMARCSDDARCDHFVVQGAACYLKADYEAAERVENDGTTLVLDKGHAPFPKSFFCH